MRKATKIKWDVDYDIDNNELPTEVVIPDDIDEDDIPDWLSDEYGFCHEGYVLEVM